MKKVFHTALADARRLRGLTVAKVVRLCRIEGVAIHPLRAWRIVERGTAPRPDEAAALSKVLGIEVTTTTTTRKEHA